MPRILKEGGWIQLYILTRMLVRPINLDFWKSGGSGFFLFKKSGDFSLNRDILKLQKKIGIQAISRLFKSVLSSIEVLWGASDLLGT